MKWDVQVGFVSFSKFIALGVMLCGHKAFRRRFTHIIRARSKERQVKGAGDLVCEYNFRGDPRSGEKTVIG
jgi:hypothetical protein